MANNFVKKSWKDRVSEFPTRRKLMKIEDSADGEYAIYSVERADGNIGDLGSPFNATTMNDLEERISQITFSNATDNNSGFMSAEDKRKLETMNDKLNKINISYGTNEPYGGSNGDIYLRYYG